MKSQGIVVAQQLARLKKTNNHLPLSIDRLENMGFHISLYGN